MLKTNFLSTNVYEKTFQSGSSYHTMSKSSDEESSTCSEEDNTDLSSAEDLSESSQSTNEELPQESQSSQKYNEQLQPDSDGDDYQDVTIPDLEFSDDDTNQSIFSGSDEKCQQISADVQNPQFLAEKMTVSDVSQTPDDISDGPESRRISDVSDTQENTAISDITDATALDVDTLEKRIYLSQERQEQQLVKHKKWLSAFVERKEKLFVRLTKINARKHTTHMNVTGMTWDVNWTI